MHLVRFAVPCLVELLGSEVLVGVVGAVVTGCLLVLAILQPSCRVHVSPLESF